MIVSVVSGSSRRTRVSRSYRLSPSSSSITRNGPLFVHARVVDVADVRAADRGGSARFAKEALADDLGGDQLRREDLHRDALADVDVLRLVDGGHPAAADLPG